MPSNETTPFKPADSLTLSVAKHIAGQIITCHLAAGSRIQEQEQAAALNVSRGVVREALLLLERWHLLQIQPRRGAVVTRMTAFEVVGLYQVWSNLMQLLTRQLVSGASDSDIATYTSLLQQLEQSLTRGQFDKFFELRIAIYEQSCRAANNPFLTRLLGDILPAAMRAGYLLAINGGPEWLMEVRQFFVDMLPLAHSRDADGAVKLLTRFYDRECTLVLAELEKQRLKTTPAISYADSANAMPAHAAAPVA